MLGGLGFVNQLFIGWLFVDFGLVCFILDFDVWVCCAWDLVVFIVSSLLFGLACVVRVACLNVIFQFGLLRVTFGDYFSWVCFDWIFGWVVVGFGLCFVDCLVVVFTSVGGFWFGFWILT